MTPDKTGVIFSPLQRIFEDLPTSSQSEKPNGERAILLLKTPSLLFYDRYMIYLDISVGSRTEETGIYADRSVRARIERHGKFGIAWKRAVFHFADYRSGQRAQAEESGGNVCGAANPALQHIIGIRLNRDILFNGIPVGRGVANPGIVGAAV